MKMPSISFHFSSPAKTKRLLPEGSELVAQLCKQYERWSLGFHRRILLNHTHVCTHTHTHTLEPIFFQCCTRPSAQYHSRFFTVCSQKSSYGCVVEGFEAVSGG